MIGRFTFPTACHGFHTKRLVATVAAIACSLGLLSTAKCEETRWMVGAAKVDITPEEPVRLSGYASRLEPTSSIEDRLFVRALVLRPVASQSGVPDSASPTPESPLVLVSIDAIGISPQMTEAILEKVSPALGTHRSRVVLCTTHAHTAPHLDGVLPNLFGPPMSESELQASKRYTEGLVAKIIDAVLQAGAQLQPGNVEYELGRAEFPINRRMIKDKKWVAIGTVDDGPVDRSVRVLRVTNGQGKNIAIAYQVACHCTSVSPEANRISGDWAGISAAHLESQFPDCIALPIIGCGADANPNPRGTIEHARAHGKELSESVLKVVSAAMKPLPAPTLATFTLVALASERPTRARLEEMKAGPSQHERNAADHWLELLTRKDRLPETYPAPVHLWTFGTELAWVFMGGEVVVDYQIRFEKELSQFANVWVAAYVDDVFAYVASERIRTEGGYEAEGSMLYYRQPGRWVSGTEETIVDRVLQLSKQSHPPEEPRSPEASLSAIEVPDGWTIELVAAEPLVTDPVNIAFGRDGKVWVVEMGDYPLGGGKSGCIKTLEDTDGDGKLDKSTVFLDGLSFPAGIAAWRDGAVVACAPEVFFARDQDGDGVCDQRITLATGFPEGNPQHRVHGFTYGMDHRLHFGPGGGTETVVATGKGLLATSDAATLRAAGCDLSLDPDTGTVRLETGVTQYIRATDDWGHWFGNENSLPMFHYVFPYRWMERSQAFPRQRYQLMTRPPSIPPVFPISQQADRFNDLYAINRFTSACSTILNRGSGQGEEMRGYALVCEPVHNLVSRMKLEPDGASWAALRIDADTKREFVRSSDPWFRPVRIENAPDGSLWIVDMYRYVIEHPEWIPEEWQRRINVRAGEDQGRIYRVRRTDFEPKPWTHFGKLDDVKLVNEILGPNGARSDLAQQELIDRHRTRGLSDECLSKLMQGMMTAFDTRARVRALATLLSIGKCTTGQFEVMLGVGDAKWLEFLLQQLDRMPDPEALREKLWAKVKPERVRESASLALAMAIESSYAKQPNTVEIAKALAMHANDRWVVEGVAFIDPKSASGVLNALLEQEEDSSVEKVQGRSQIIEKLLPQTLASQNQRLLQLIAQPMESRPAWHFTFARQFALANPSRALEPAQVNNLLASARKAIDTPEEKLATKIAAAEWMLSKMGPNWGPDHARLLSALQKASASDGDREWAGWLARTLVRLRGESTDRVLGVWSALSEGAKRAALSDWTKTPESIERLIEAIEQGKVSAGDLDAVSLQAMRSAATGALAEKVLTRFGPAPGADRAAIVRHALEHWPNRSAASASQPGADAATGKVAYEKHCAVCHEPRKAGDKGDNALGGEVALGPALGGLAHWTNEAWLTAILDPNRAVDDKYRAFQAMTEDGEVITGLKLREDETSIEWVDAQGRVASASKGSLSNVQSTARSLMPEGFEQLLRTEEIADIIRYLRLRQDR